MQATLIDGVLEALRIGAGFLWTAAWAISMGLTVTSLVQVYVSKERMARVLGVCTSELSHETLSEEIELGALLPCNVVIYETDGGKVVVSAVDPKRLLSVANNTALDTITNDVYDRVGRVLAAIGDDS